METKMKKISLSALTSVLFALIITGCISTPNFARTDPLNVGESNGTAVLRVSNPTVSNSERPFVKINDVTLSTDEIILPAGSNEYAVKFKFKGKTKYVAQANINMDLVAGKTYLLSAEFDNLTTGLSGFMMIPGPNLIALMIAPYRCQFKLYEYSEDLKKKKFLQAIKPKKLKWKEF
jgi:hypothetical protein